MYTLKVLAIIVSSLSFVSDGTEQLLQAPSSSIASFPGDSTVQFLIACKRAMLYSLMSGSSLEDQAFFLFLFKPQNSEL